MVRNFKKDVLVSGFALFAMFFGAGNLIFPPFLGWDCGSKWIEGIICFILVDVGLSLLVLFVLAQKGKGPRGVTEDLGPRASELILCANVVCLGPLIAIPRTAATAFALAVKPVLPSVNSWLFAAVFFAVVVLLSIRRTKALDIIGTVLAPLSFTALLFLIVRGVVSPLGPVTEASAYDSVVRAGILSGYQTMDMMGTVILSTALLFSITDKGYTEVRDQFRIIAGAGLVAAAALMVVYGGLAYVGATMSERAGLLDRTTLLVTIAKLLLGENGFLLLGGIVLIACLSTAVGLVSSSASFFADRLGGRVSYRTLVFAFAAVSCVISNFGLDSIIAHAAPVLDLLYPVLLTVTVLGLFHGHIADKRVYKYPTAVAFLVSLAVVLDKSFDLNMQLLRLLPFSSLGLAWLAPAALCAAVSLIVFNGKKRRPSSLVMSGRETPAGDAVVFH